MRRRGERGDVALTSLLVGSLDGGEYAAWHAHLTQALPDERIVLAGEPHDPAAIDIAFVANPPHGALAHYPALRFIQSLWAGVDRLLGDPSLPDVPVARLVDPDLTQAMVESVVAHVTALHRQTYAYARRQAQREWKPLDQPLARNRRVAILGLGELGAAVAGVLAGLSFPVSGWSRSPRRVEGVECLSGDHGIETLLARADILVNLLPLTPDTTSILDRDLFARLPKGAGLVNVARGAHLVEGDLLAALDEDRIGHAILDVFHEEPLPPDHPFWSHPRISVFPHVAAYSAPESAARIAAANVLAFRQGRPMTGLVDRTRGY